MTDDGALLTAQLCERLHEIRWDELPPEVQRKATLCLQDHVACAFGGAETEWGQMGVAYARAQEGAPRATVLATGDKLPAELAAFSNGHLANMLDYDDTNLDLGHPGATVWPAALAAAELSGATGEQFMTAAIAGYELGMRLAMATRPSDQRFRLVYPTPWKGAAAATAAAIALGLDADSLRDAVGISFLLSPMASAMTPETTFAFKAGQMGQYAEAGVKAALFAKMGFTGKKNIFGRDVPLSIAMGSDRYEPAWLEQDELLFPTISFKPYPACRFTHTAIEAAQQARESGLRPEDMRSITLYTFQRAMQLRDPEPKNFAHGPFCLPYVVAVALCGLEPGPSWYSDQRTHDPAILNVSRRIELKVDQAINDLTDRAGKLAARLVLTTNGGAEVDFYIETALGEMDRPVTEEQLARKFRALVASSLGTSGADRLQSALRTLPAARNVESLVDLVVPNATAGIASG